MTRPPLSFLTCNCVRVTIWVADCACVYARVRELAGEERPAPVVGGFPRGHFSPQDLRAIDKLVRVDDSPLDAFVAASAAYEERNLRRQG